jgi:ornithine cyclodeaminase/alanine dehydrogenase-like protein (mu-crystallin family)
MDGAWVTEMRTAGVSGVVLRQVAPSQRRLAIVGCGAQGRRHLDMILAERPEIEEVRAYDWAPAAIAALLGGVGGRRAVAAASAEEAIEAADLVVTALTVSLGDGRLSAAGTAPDAVLLPLDYDDAMSAEAARGASLYAVDDLGQYRSVFGEHFGGFPEPHAELAQVVAGAVPVPATGRRLFMNLGIAMDDVALGALVYDRARERGAGRTVAFP